MQIELNQNFERIFQSIRKAMGPYTSPKIAAMLVLGFSSGLPILLIYGTFSTRLREAGISRTTIGFLSLIGLFYAFKFLWAPLVDRLKVPGLANLLGHRRAWIFVCQIGLIFGLITLGISDPASNLTWTAMCAIIVAFFSATQDIVIDGWRIDVADDEEHGEMAAATQTGYRFGLIAAGGGALAFADAINWSSAYWAMAFLMAIAGIGLFKACEPDRSMWSADQQSYKPIAMSVILAVAGALLATLILMVVPTQEQSYVDAQGVEQVKELNLFRNGAMLYYAGAWVPLFIGALSFLLPQARSVVKQAGFSIPAEIAKAVGFIVGLGLVLLLIVQGFRTFPEWPSVISEWNSAGGIAPIGGIILSAVKTIVESIQWVLGGIGSGFGVFISFGGVYALILLAISPFLFASGLGVWLRNSPTSPHLTSNVALGAFVDYARKYGPGAGLLLLMIATYRMTDTTMGVMAKPFYVDHGFTKTEFGLVSGSIGPWILIVGAVFAGVSVRFLGFFRSLIIGEILMITTNAAFAWLAHQPEAVFWQLFVTVTADNIAAGFAGTVFIAYMSSLTSKGFSATQYALFTSFFALYGKLLASMSGVLADRVDWEMFFILTALVGVPAMAVIWLVHHFKADQPLGESAAS